MVKLPIVGHVMSLVRNSGGGKAKRLSLTREERLRLGFEQAPVGIALASADGHWLQINDRFRDLIGYTREELARITFHSITHPDDAKKEAAQVRKLVGGDVDTFRFEKRVMEKRGQYRSIDVVTSIVRLDGGGHFFVYVIEDSAHAAPKRADGGVREAERMLATLVDQLQDVAIIRTDDKGVITGWNSGAERIFGYKRDEILGKNRRTLYRDADSWAGTSTRQLKVATEGTDRVESEDWRVTKDGRHLWVKTAITPFRPDGTVRGFIEVVSAPAATDAKIDAKAVTEQAVESLKKSHEKTVAALRADVDKGKRTEESLREALEQIRVMGEETMNELKVMATALRNEIDRRKAAEDELRAAKERIAELTHAAVPVEAAGAPVEIEIELEPEELIELPPRRRLQSLAGKTPVDLLLAHAEAQRSGTLILSMQDRVKEIFFDKGRVFACASNDPQKFLTQRLIELGYITEEQRLRAMEIKRETQLALGRILLILGAITEEQLVEVMRAKMEDEIAEVFDWKDARWVFVEGEVPSLQLVPLRIEITPLVVQRLARNEVPLVGSSAPKSKKKYHRAGCSVAARIAEKVRLTFPSEQEAAAQGYEACRLCFR
jgi:PAS domain S-box-containing protein